MGVFELYKFIRFLKSWRYWKPCIKFMLRDEVTDHKELQDYLRTAELVREAVGANGKKEIDLPDGRADTARYVSDVGDKDVIWILEYFAKLVVDENGNPAPIIIEDEI